MTLFPDLVHTVLGESIIGRAQKSGAIKVTEYNIRDYSEDKHRRVDDTPYGGGKGMLMAAPPIYNCYLEIMKDLSGTVRRVYMSPKGKVLTQDDAKRLSEYDNLIILCGHYEGVDQRICDEIIDEEISIGDYVLTGGEIPACILVDAVARLVDFRGRTVPEVLISGDHKKIADWRRSEAEKITAERRPDLLKKE